MNDVDYRVTVDVGRVNNLLTQLNDKQAKTAIKAGLRKSISIIRKQTQMNMDDISPNFRNLKKGVSMAVYKNASGARVDLIPRGTKTPYKTFVLRFFELGTDDGKTNKKGNYRGKKIKEYHFLKKATESKRNEAEKMLEENIINSIKRIIDRNK